MSVGELSLPARRPLRLGTVLLPIAIVFVGAVLRFHLLDKRDFWVDEAASVYFVQLPWGKFWQALWDYQGNMSFYYVLLRGWLALGDSEAAIRSLSVLFGVATIAAIYALGKLMFDRNAATAAAALSAVNLFQIRYSQEARAYSLVILMVVLSTYFFVRAQREPGRRGYWAVYIIVSALAVYSHLYAYLVIGAQWLALGPRKMQLVPMATLLYLLASFLLLTLPFNLFVLRTSGELYWLPQPTPRIVMSFAKLLTGNGGIPLLAAYAIACLPLIGRWGPVSAPANFEKRWCARLVTLWLFFPIVATLLVSLYKPVFYDRYLAICAPALALLAGHGIAGLAQRSRRTKIVAAGLFAGMLVLSALGIQRYDRTAVSFGDHWKAVTRQIIQNQLPGDVALLYRPSGFWPYRYYVAQESPAVAYRAPVVVYPTDTINPEQTISVDDATAIVRGHRRVWLVLQHLTVQRDHEDAGRTIEAALVGYRIVSEASFPGATGPIIVKLYAAQGMVNR
jgi:mannosyltransferase